ncbi:hypothetical protein JJE66_16605 [Bradyrhizobium diazoefficiens]|uniref:hypothetical protein n=1 Tax=Bradyrhizobium diazoefficiens TaxID=1355477 RepID=UPI00190B073E|nr:hypothetical protein [Bradyrhizobium diazoefficiens]
MTIDRQVSNDGLDDGAAAQLALDDTEHPALLAGDEDTARILYVIPRYLLSTLAPSIAQSVSVSGD